MADKTQGAETATPAPVEPKADAPKVEAVTPEVTPTETVKDAAWWESKAKAMEAESKRNAKRLAELEKTEQARIDAEKSELQKAQERADKAEKDVAATKLALLRRDVVAETKLPAELADFLKGETQEELTASAAILLKSIPQRAAPSGNVTNPGSNATHGGETENERRARLGLRTKKE